MLNAYVQIVDIIFHPGPIICIYLIIERHVVKKNEAWMYKGAVMVWNQFKKKPSYLGHLFINLWRGKKNGTNAFINVVVKWEHRYCYKTKNGECSA